MKRRKFVVLIRRFAANRNQHPNSIRKEVVDSPALRAGESTMSATEGLLIFTSAHVEERFLECMGWARVPNARSVFVNNYRIQKYTLQGVVYAETLIRAGDVRDRAARLRQRLGNAAQPVFVVASPAGGGGSNNNIFTINSLQDVVTHFPLQQPLSPAQCNTLRQLLEEPHRPETLRNMLNPETPGDAETEFANQFFGALSRGQHMRPPDSDLFQGSTAVFLLQGGDRFAIVHNSEDEDADFRLAQQLSLQEESLHSRGLAGAEGAGETRGNAKRPRRTAPTDWSTVLKEPEPLTPGCAACITCHSYRASICFAACGHQVMCDKCVREMCELPGVRVACPICRCESEGILRPVLSASEPEDTKGPTGPW